MLDQNLYWQHVDYKAYPERLTNRYGGESASKLLPVDIIITTTDPFKEPALMTANTVLSVLALDYPGEYESLQKKISEALETGKAPLDSISQKAIEGFVYRSADIRNHSSVVQVIHENKKGEENEGVNLPHLIYVAREKRPMVGHHYKAGAMNVMVRVSGIMTNAPYILNLDCDMHESLRSTFGESSTLVASTQTIMRDTGFKIHSSPSLLEEEALKVASCTYETRTAWGKEVGWIYGTTVEDVMTGLKVHSLGWNSIYYVPEKPTFMGRTPVNSPDALVQLQRGGTGLLEIFISKSSPFLGMNRHIPLRQRMVYVYLVIWPTCSVPTLCYVILPAFSLLSGKSFLPKIQDPNFAIVVAMFLSLYGFKILEHILNGCSTREWLNNQRMWFIVSISSWIFSFFDVGMKIVGLSETVFVVTPKGSGDEEQVNEGDFTFGSSPLFIPPTTVLLINLAVIFYNIIGFVGGLYGIKDMQLAEFFCSVWVVFNLVPFLKGLVRKGKGGLPWNIVISSTALVLFVWSIIVRLGNFG
ncbi:hypothetical protein KI387_035367 [Taxus chinensis]|uniref:Uncharacterized protein n=1 Tax=Taxus chinensis TaxID=29808 RepID=A0AA38FNH1_TAXCH|nr:hypothetical protein KI387_035367 [Taxus chinensis]